MFLKAPRPKVDVNRGLMIRALLATLIMIALFFGGVVPAKAAIIIGGLLLLTRRVKSRRVYAEVDWSLLLMFAGLFIIVAGAQHALLSPDIIAAVGRLHLDQLPVLTAVTAGLSNRVSNVPVRVDAEAVCRCAERSRHGLAGRRDGVDTGRQLHRAGLDRQFDRSAEAVSGVTIGFWDYFRVGAPLTIITLMIGTLWLRSM